MSTTEQATAISLDETAGRDAERVINPIVPANGISGRALVVVIAIMAFLASLTIGLVTAISSAADSWAGDLGQELTIQVMPQEGRDVAADAQEAALGIAGNGVFDLDHVRAPVGHYRTGGGYKGILRNFEDAHALHHFRHP